MPDLTRRGFIAASLATSAARLVPPVVATVRQKRVLTVVYDRALGAMRAIDRVVP